jgi:hypothetical protein
MYFLLKASVEAYFCSLNINHIVAERVRSHIVSSSSKRSSNVTNSLKKNASLKGKKKQERNKNTMFC